MTNSNTTFSGWTCTNLGNSLRLGNALINQAGKTGQWT